tara:strand:- start:4 stop:1302 length:1299 start_codon:yes stop_codon:yes gene_type:complete
MDMIEQQNYLESMDDAGLVKMSQNPTYIPAFLVLQEVKRRSDFRKNYQAMVNKPTTTVAEEVVSDFAQPTGLQGGAPQTTPLSTNISAGLSGAPTASMQMAASGGITGYATGDMTSLPAGSAPVQTKFGAAGEFILDQGSNLVNWAKENPTDAALTGLMFAPGVGWVASAGLKSIQLATKAMKGKNIFKSLYSKSKPLDIKTTPTPKILNQKGLSAADDLGYSSGKSAFGDIAKDRAFSPLRYYGSTASIFGGKKAYDYGMSPANPDDIVSDTEPNTFTQEQYDAAIAQAKKDEKTRLEGLAGAAETMQSENKGDYRDLVRLGAGIMSAKNIGDIGTAVTGVLDAQDKRGLVGLQGKLTEAQTLKLEADIASMDKDSILARMTNLIKASEAGLITDMEAATIQYNALAKQLAELEGKEEPTGSDILDRRKIA